MPLILALNMSAVCGTAALAMQASRKWWVATVAAMLLAFSPFASYGVLQELLPQVWGLGLAAVLVALLMRPELHGEPGPSVADLVLIGIVATALVTVYIELASTIALAYAIYLTVLALRRQLVLQSVLRLLVPPVAFLAIFLNTYLVKELEFVRHQATGGLANVQRHASLAFVVVPSAMPSIIGLQTFAAGTGASYLAASIVVGAILLAAIVIMSLFTTRAGIAAVTVLVAYLGLGVFLWIRSADFGLFKLYMYVQPFLAASVAVWLGRTHRRPLLVLAASVLAVTAIAELRTQHLYVDRSRDPIDLRHASAQDLLPAFRRHFASARAPVVSATDNPTLAKLEAASIGSRPLYLISRDIVGALVRRDSFPHGGHGWDDRAFRLFSPGGQTDSFSENRHTSRLLDTKTCLLIEQTGTQLALNRILLPEGSPDLSARPCGTLRNRLIFTDSQLGQSFYLFTDREAVSFYQLEPDFFFKGHTLAAFGRYALFRVAGAPGFVRLALNLTTTVRHDGSNTLPPALVIGDQRVKLPLVGRGSARVYSAPLRPQIIGGQPYLLVDMGREPTEPPSHRPGVTGLFNSSLPLDPRMLTAYVRDISLVGVHYPGRMRAPTTLQHFPADLGNPGLEYSGIYEDGWVGQDSYAVLAGGGARRLVIRAQVLPRANQHLTVLVNGAVVRSSAIAPGEQSLAIDVKPSNGNRRVELRWAETVHLRNPDNRPASARLGYLGFPPPPSSLIRLPQDLAKPGLSARGVYKDGWLQKAAQLVLAGGPAGRLSLRAMVTPATLDQHLELLLNGKTIASRSVGPGSLTSTSRSALRLSHATSRCAGESPRPSAPRTLAEHPPFSATSRSLRRMRPTRSRTPLLNSRTRASLRVASTRTAG